MCDLISKPKVTFAAWKDRFSLINQRPLYHTPEELERLAWKNDPAKVNKIQNAILMQFITPQPISLNWGPHLRLMWEVANDRANSPRRSN